MSYMVCKLMYSSISRHVGSLVRVILDVVDERFQGFGSLKRQGNTVKPVLISHLKIDKMKVLKTGGSLMQVESIAKCSCGAFCNTFDLHLAI